MLFSASPLVAADVPDELFPEEDSSNGNTTDIEASLLEQWAGMAAEDVDELQTALIEEGDEHVLVMDAWEEDSALTMGIALDNQEIEFTEDEAVAVATDEVQDRLELLFVDTRIVGFSDLAENLKANVAAGVELVVLTFDPTRDGLVDRKSVV